ncbi:cation tolerance protein CutA [Mesorhizobium ephedrae]|uniref:Cation tolerance protein CutA n=2 Tax=Kumtagia ephedrae TaxID=2116701 RepID=A0A2P7RHC7_9HYPH|nr:cation tolerance protein CutA [Mesorhizobium ephedrae]
MTDERQASRHRLRKRALSSGQSNIEPAKPSASGVRPAVRRGPMKLCGSVAALLLIAALLVFAVELTARGSLEQTLLFFQQPFRPGWTTIVLFALLIVFLDALLGRPYHALFLLAPVALGLAFVGQQKAFYLGDPLYPTDFLYARQIVELLPLLVRQRPGTAVAFAAAAVLAIVLLIVAWRFWRRRAPRLTFRARLSRLAVALPALVFFGSLMDYATFSWARDRLQISPVMWDQKENYNSNGFAIAFALNVPMAKVAAPKGYSEEAIKAIAGAAPAPLAAPAEKPDIIVVMSESFWDPTRLPATTVTPDPMPTVRALGSGHVLSPEFGGMTANVEFEALTGFSNAFLPYGSIPYQQYVRAPMPSLATFLKSEGYSTRAFHPFAGWFWNRSSVYHAFGFDRFLSEESLPPLEKRGPLAADTAFVDAIIREAEWTVRPFFYFAVTLQGHGPYEPNRYPDSRIAVDGPMSEAARGALRTFATGIADADESLARLIDWASKRQRPTIIAFFGDHLPPLGQVFVETGFMKGYVADRNAPLETLALEHETPLVLWSNRTGAVKDLGSISPAFLPLHLMRTAGFSHPYYTGFLGAVHDRFLAVDRNMLVARAGTETPNWARSEQLDPLIRDYRYLQYDLIFGKRFGDAAFFPKPPESGGPRPVGW